MMFKRISTTPDRGAKRPQLSRQRRINVTAASATTALAEAFSEWHPQAYMRLQHQPELQVVGPPQCQVFNHGNKQANTEHTKM
eukprot:4004379-Ditylum_brightwellii.AAC.1